MNTKDKIAVCSRSFSNNEILRSEVKALYKNVKFNEEGKKLVGEQLIEFLKGHNKAIIAMEKLDNYILSALPELKVVSKYGVGVDNIDLKTLRQLRKKLGWKGGVNRRSVSELTLSLMLSMLRFIPSVNKQILQGSWKQSIGEQLTGKIVGILGCGNVGKDLINLLKPFDCEILVNDILSFPEFCKENSLQPVSLDKLIMCSDIITLHVPLTNLTHNIINAERLNKIKQDAILINTARGGLIDENELKRLLIKGKLKAAAFDVFENEPPQDRELLSLPNFLATPHIGGSTKEAVLAMGRAAIIGLEENNVP